MQAATDASSSQTHKIAGLTPRQSPLCLDSRRIAAKQRKDVNCHSVVIGTAGPKVLFESRLPLLNFSYRISEVSEPGWRGTSRAPLGHAACATVA